MGVSMVCSHRKLGCKHQNEDNMASYQSLQVIVVSIPEDLTRREILKNRFPLYYDQFEFIDAVDMRRSNNTHHDAPPPCSYNKRKPLSGPEIGCALSHIKALEYFLTGPSPYVLILEDDVIGLDNDINRIIELTSYIPDDTIVICGGQQGLRGWRNLYGKSELSDNVFRIHKMSKRFLSRACCYLVTRSVARQLIRRQYKCLDRADHWQKLLSNDINVYFCNILMHPFELGSSHIELGRQAYKRESIIRRIFRDGFIRTIINNLIKLYSRIIYPVFGYTRISTRNK